MAPLVSEADCHCTCKLYAIKSLLSPRWQHCLAQVCGVPALLVVIITVLVVVIIITVKNIDSWSDASPIRWGPKRYP